MQVFWFKDSKVGHLKQVKALLGELKKEIKFDVTPVECEKNSLSLGNQDISSLLSSAEETVLLIGAGHATYPRIIQSNKILKAHRKIRSISVAILRPSRHLSSFDLIFAPEHDYSEKRIPNNVTTFQGSLAKPSFAQPHENQAIIAIGGTSKHYKFDVNTMINQLHYILSTHPKYEFQIYNSRRTPEAANQKILNELNGYNNADFIDINNPKSQFFENRLSQSMLKFVTPDSSNLVFEALSTVGKTYLVQIESSKYRRWFGTKKIRVSMNALVASKTVGTVSILSKTGGVNISNITNPLPALEPLAEIEKVAFSIVQMLKKLS